VTPTPADAAPVGVVAALLPPAGASAQDVDDLVWCDHTDDALIGPFEEAHGMRTKLREHEGTGAALAIPEQSRPGEWEVVVIDAIGVPRAVDAGLLAPSPADELPVADPFPEVAMEESTTRDGETYAVTEKLGYDAVSYDADAVDGAHMASLASIVETYPGRIALHDHRLPMMGLAAIEAGIETTAIGSDHLPALREELAAMREASASVGGVVASRRALAAAEVEVVIGGGAWLTATLDEERPGLTWTIPEAGAVRWAQSIGVLADGERRDLAVEFVRHVVSPEGQAALATSSCFWGMPANRQARDVLSQEQRAVLRWDPQEAYLAPRPGPPHPRRRARGGHAGPLARDPPAVSRLVGWGLVAPALLWTVAFLVVPFAVMAAMSLATPEGRELRWGLGLADYAALLERAHLLRAGVPLLEITLTVTVVPALPAYPPAAIIAFRVPPL
jgi:spermidine/putrescine transport system substrate-binding protein